MSKLFLVENIELVRVGSIIMFKESSRKVFSVFCGKLSCTFAAEVYSSRSLPDRSSPSPGRRLLISSTICIGVSSLIFFYLFIFLKLCEDSNAQYLGIIIRQTKVQLQIHSRSSSLVSNELIGTVKLAQRLC